MKSVCVGWRDRTISLHSLAVFAEIFVCLFQSKNTEFLVLGGTPLIPSPPVAANCGYVLDSGSKFDSDFVSFAQRLIDAWA